MRERDRRATRLWRLAERQHGVVARRQLAALGYSPGAIRHRLAEGRLFRVHAGIYALGRPALSREGRLLAAVLACGPGAMLSHSSAAGAYGIVQGLGVASGSAIELSVPLAVVRRHRGLVVHRRTGLGPQDVRRWREIAIASPALTLVDLASRLSRRGLEAAIAEADRRNVIDPETLRNEIRRHRRRPGGAALEAILDHGELRTTDSELERMFLRLLARAGLPRPQTGARVNGFKVDFHWPELGLVVETDGLTYHRTAASQARDRLRDQAHAASGLATLRFTNAQVRDEPEYVARILSSVIDRTAPNPGD